MGGGAHPFFKLGHNEKCVKGMQVRSRGRSEEVHHIPHTWVNSCRKACFSGLGRRGGHNLRTGQILAEG